MLGNQGKIPMKAVEYIKSTFRKEFVFDLKGVRKYKGQQYYLVDVSKDDYIHHLRFNQSGHLVEAVADEAFPSDENY